MTTAYKDMSIEALVKLKAEIESLITQKQKEKKIELKKQFKEMAEEAGLTIDDILSSVKEKKPVKEYKYIRETETGTDVWVGRGPRPQWIKDEIERKVDIEIYRVKPQA